MDTLDQRVIIRTDDPPVVTNNDDGTYWLEFPDAGVEVHLTERQIVGLMTAIRDALAFDPDADDDLDDVNERP